MTTPRKRPSVKNKKTARPAVRASVPSVDAVVDPAAQSGDATAGSAPRAMRQDASVGAQPSENSTLPVLDAQDVAVPADSDSSDAPADFFDLSDTPAPEGGAGDAASGNREARPSARKRARGRGKRAGGDASEPVSRDTSRADSASAKRAGKKPSRAVAAKRDGGAGKRAGSKIGGRRIAAIVCSAALCAVIAAAGLYVWNTYLRYDDAADIQGEWRTQDASMTVVIDATDIRMPDLEYSYEMNTGAKKLTFHFSDLSGSGSYSFSSDRSVLTIVEGEGESAVSTVLVRVSDDIQATPRLLEGGVSSDGSSADAQADASSNGDASSDGQGAEGEAGTGVSSDEGAAQ